MAISLTPNVLQIELSTKDDEPLQIDATEFRGQPKVGLRQTFRGKQDGKLYFGKQGINIPEVDFLNVVVAMLETYNGKHGTEYRLEGSGDAETSNVIDAYENVQAAKDVACEPVYQWAG
jgi:hypothetical protein